MENDVSTFENLENEAQTIIAEVLKMGGKLIIEILLMVICIAIAFICVMAIRADMDDKRCLIYCVIIFICIVITGCNAALFADTCKYFQSPAYKEERLRKRYYKAEEDYARFLEVKDANE